MTGAALPPEGQSYLVAGALDMLAVVSAVKDADRDAPDPSWADAIGSLGPERTTAAFACLALLVVNNPDALAPFRRSAP